MKRAAIALGLLGLSACGSSPRASAPAPAPAAPPPSAGAVADTCGAKGLQSLIGRPRTDVPPAQPAKPQRVICTTCAMTMDYNPERLNVFFDAATGRIKEVRCG